MIQRVQSLYLFIAGLICVLAVMFNIAISKGQYAQDGQLVPAIHGVKSTNFNGSEPENKDNQNIQKVQYLPIDNDKTIYFSYACAFVCLITIFLYKNLALQLRIAGLSGLVFLGLIFTAFIDDMSLGKSFVKIHEHAYSWQLLFLLSVPVMIFLAIRGIKHDIEILASEDRLR